MKTSQGNFNDKIDEFRKIFDSYQTIRNFWINKNLDDDVVPDTYITLKSNRQSTVQKMTDFNGIDEQPVYQQFEPELPADNLLRQHLNNRLNGLRKNPVNMDASDEILRDSSIKK